MDDLSRDKEIQDIIDFEYTYHFFFNYGLFDQFIHLEDLISETSAFLKSSCDSLVDSKPGDIVDVRFDKRLQFQIVFPEILWKSIFLSIYFLTENSLDQICNNLEKVKNNSLSLKDISGNGIYRSSNYLKKVCDISSCFGSKEWHTIMDFNKIRNVLVHSDGVFPKENIRLTKIISKYKEISLYELEETKEYSFNINEGFTKLSLDIVTIFFRLIWNEMNDKKASR